MSDCPHPGTGTPCPSCIEEQFGDDERDPFGYLREDAGVRTDGGQNCCERCGADIPGTPNRWRIQLTDAAESSGAFIKGRLCRKCWRDMLALMRGTPLAAGANGTLRDGAEDGYRADGGAVMAPPPEDDDREGEVWMPGGGVVADRVNELIDVLVRTMNEQEVYRIRAPKIDEVAARVLPVGREGTLMDYRTRALRFGPFEPDESFWWVLDEEYREEES